MTRTLDLVVANDLAAFESRRAHAASDTALDEMIAASRKLHASAAAIVADMKNRTISTGWFNVDGFNMKTGRARRYPDHPATRVHASTDGLPFKLDWHTPDDGDPHGEAVFVEVWSFVDEAPGATRTFHGWVDPVSRRIVQAG